MQRLFLLGVHVGGQNLYSAIICADSHLSTPAVSIPMFFLLCCTHVQLVLPLLCGM